VQLLQGRYRVTSHLGGGGFGRTYLAVDTHMPTGRQCVIKQLKPVANNSQISQLVQERFQREAAVLEDLGQGNNQIPQLYAYFAEGGQFYLVQEWIEGVTLSQKMQQQGLLSESSAKELLVNILPVLDYVHSKRIVHRDIKPDNIIVRSRDGKPVLIDFGAVRETMGTVVTTGGNVNSSIVIGTPGFMASEQAAGRPVYSSDLYSLGLTTIYLLSGKLPQELETDPHSGEILWRRHVLNVSPSLAGVLDKVIASHPGDRYPTARDMLDALQGDVGNLGGKTNSPIAPQPSNTTVSSPPPQVVSPSGASPQNTPITPPSPNPGNKQNAVIMGSLIASGLIAASFVIASAFKQSPQLSTQTTSASAPVTQPSVSPAVARQLPPQGLAPVAVVPSPEITTPPTVSPSTPVSSIPELSADYSRLENLLSSGRFKEADRETTRLMIRVGRPEKATYLDRQSIKQFPCNDLRNIDQLWAQYSNGNFGFSVQKRIWDEVGEDKEGFDERVGWRANNKKLNSDNLNFSLQAPTGHLPYVNVLKHKEFFSLNRCL